MYYKLIMCDSATDTRIERTVEAKSVFDAIDLVASELERPEDVELVEAVPVGEEVK